MTKDEILKLADIIFKYGLLVLLSMMLGVFVNISKQISHISSRIGQQTHQIDWLVTHYAKPVRPLYIWEKSKCEWCGSEILESDHNVYHQDK